jgi:putative RNA 2'-phosphotransferase
MSDDVTRASKFLAYVLRHDPGAIGLSLGEGGWVRVGDLAAAARRHGRRLDAAMIDRVQSAPGKKRFETRDGLIRAAQGHSVPVDLGLAPCQPPPVLYHGTVARFLDGIFAGGLRPGARTHVHLSADPETAATVGARRGGPVVLRIDSAALRAGGHEFFQAANGVWLTAHVPPAFISFAGRPPDPSPSSTPPEHG